MCKPTYTWCTDLCHVHNKELRTTEGQSAPHLATRYLETIGSLEERKCSEYHREAYQISIAKAPVKGDNNAKGAKVRILLNSSRVTRESGITARPDIEEPVNAAGQQQHCAQDCGNPQPLQLTGRRQEAPRIDLKQSF
ncbi:hypothetical protein TSAR_009754 [Trichomalopsis sarcophagae]|uniref:Uncharacterized protein n=1 Tax=Trichomalopsis sarcophagae TaxID=543379 RepID=A0A232EPE3_9HYME|nr:hypothetical protein TSAR_009754 [Trichomalopsis sarcophagae]